MRRPPRQQRELNAPITCAHAFLTKPRRSHAPRNLSLNRATRSMTKTSLGCRGYILRSPKKPSPSSPWYVHETLALGGRARKSMRVRPVMLPEEWGPTAARRPDEWCTAYEAELTAERTGSPLTSSCTVGFLRV
uniref:Uncharacterized protein n=1 Tax=Calcidiscus leptoporus TaxID=127549 RepID=A0A7S0J140_9EUKA